MQGQGSHITIETYTSTNTTHSNKAAQLRTKFWAYSCCTTSHDDDDVYQFMCWIFWLLS